MGMKVHQFHLVMKILIVRFIKGKVQDANHIDSLQLVVPRAALSLFTNGEGGIIYASVLEELLLAALHLHQELLSLLVFAIHVEHRTAVIFPRA